MRPIVAGPSCATSRLSDFLEILLKPYLKHVKSYVRESVDFLNDYQKKRMKRKYLSRSTLQICTRTSTITLPKKLLNIG